MSFANSSNVMGVQWCCKWSWSHRLGILAKLTTIGLSMDFVSVGVISSFSSRVVPAKTSASKQCERLPAWTATKSETREGLQGKGWAAACLSDKSKFQFRLVDWKTVLSSLHFSSWPVLVTSVQTVTWTEIAGSKGKLFLPSRPEIIHDNFWDN